MRKSLPLLLLALAAAQASFATDPAGASAASASAANGEALYAQHCARCHSGGVPRAPDLAALRKLSPRNVSFALTQGSMKVEAAPLSAAQRSQLVRFIAGGNESASGAAGARVASTCPVPRSPFTLALRRPHWSGWGVGPTQTRFQPADQAGLTAADVPRLALKWAFAFPGVAKMAGQPAVMDGRLFIGTTGREVYSLDASSGCVYWKFQTDFPVRTAISIGQAGNRDAIFFGDQRANAYALDADSGELLWKTQVESYPDALITGSPTLVGHMLYVPVASNEDAYGASPKYSCCKFRGSVSALDAYTGRVLWKSYTIAEAPHATRKNAAGTELWGPSGAGVWSSPTVDASHHRLYVTTGNSHSDPAASTSDSFVAFDLRTGRMLWSHQATTRDAYTLGCDLPPPYRVNCPAESGPDFDFASSAMLVSLSNGHRLLIAGQKSGVLHAIDPDAEGRVVWEQTVGHGGRVGGIQWGSATDGRNVYVALSDVAIHPALPGTPGAQSALGASLELDPRSGGGLSAFDIATGTLRWHTPHPGCRGKPGCSPAQSAAVTAIPGVVFSGGLDGHLRAYDALDGRIIWDVDTERDYQTVNGVPGHGGSLDGPGPVVVGGILYVDSGYAYLGWAPGNVLLAFSVDGK